MLIITSVEKKKSYSHIPISVCVDVTLAPSLLQIDD